jgi:AcrR family transcriptional regulator
VAFVEERGLRSLSMSALARAMGVPVTSVHWHFRTRDDLLDALTARMTDDLYHGLAPLVGSRPWDEELVGVYTALRHQLRKMPAFLQLAVDDSRVLGRPTVKPRFTDRVRDEVALLMAAGFSEVDAYRLLHLCSVYVRGFVLLELRAERYNEHAGGVDPTWPVAVPVPDMYDLWGDAEAQFRFGLELLFAGVKATLVDPR